MAERRHWTRDETLLAFRLYCGTPFGRLHQTHPDIVALAVRINRTAGAVAMKACNFASLDPTHRNRDVVGLANRSRLDEQIWAEFTANSEALADEAERVHDTFTASEVERETPPEFNVPEGATETERTTRVRRVQSFFRRAVLTSYGHRCALTGLAVPQLLNASHIIPWSAPTPVPGSEGRRADPANGLCLNALHDRAFDRGLLTFDEDRRAVLSPALGDDEQLGRLAPLLRQTQGQPLTMPERFAPSGDALAYHRQHVFVADS